MSKESLLVTIQDRVMTLRLNRPDKCNALDGALVEQLREAFTTASRDPQIQTLLLTGEGKHFCAGADIEWMRKLSQGSFKPIQEDARNLASLLYSMHCFPKPLVCLVQGRVIGGGLGLLACSDLVIASEEADFCFSEVKLGLIPAIVSPYVLARIGQSAAGYYFLTAERFNAKEALRLGLTHQIVAQDHLAERGNQLIQTILQHSPAALGEVKQLLSWVTQQKPSPALSEKTADLFAKMRVSKQAQEGLRAFLEKRPPRWEEEA